MNRARISVITPMYNSAGFIHKTLKHVFSSTYDNYEVNDHRHSRGLEETP